MATRVSMADGGLRARRAGRVVGAAIAVAVVCTVLSASLSPARDRAPMKVAAKALPDVLLVTIDTTRHDQIWLGDRCDPALPFICSLVEEGTAFRRAYAPASWTAPSIVSMLTGSYPDVHGVAHAHVSEGEVRDQPAIPEDLQWLPSTLQSAGYRTMAVVANAHLDPALGFARGFDRYRYLGWANADAVGAAVESLASELARPGPVFLWLHLFDPHAPYAARAPWFDEAWPSPLSGYPELNHVHFGTRHMPAEMLAMPREQLAYVRASYASELRAVDAFLADLVEDRPRLARALTVFTSDHGEEFLEHGGFGHSRNLHEESVRVPLVFRYPGHRLPRGDQTAVSLVDIHPTIAGLIRRPLPTSTRLDGVDLLDRSPRVGHRHGPIFAMLTRGESNSHMVVEAGWKLLTTDGRRTLYDLTADPGERTGVQREFPSVTRRMAKLLADRRAYAQGRRPPPAQRSVSADHVERLRAMGYVQ